MLRKIGIAFLFCICVLAIAGPGTASAEGATLCKVNETPCSSGNKYPSGTEVVLRSKGPVRWVAYWEGFKVQEVECPEVIYKAKTSNAGSSTETVAGTFTSLEMPGLCKGCSVTTQAGSFAVDWTSETMNGSLTTSGFFYGFHCSGGSISFGSEIKEGGTLIGGSPALVKFEEAPVPVITKFPPGTKHGTYNAEFEVVSPKPLYVSNG